MACAIHGHNSLCGFDCPGYVHSEVPDAPPPAPPAPSAPDTDVDDLDEMPEGAVYPEGESEAGERVGEREVAPSPDHTALRFMEIHARVEHVEQRLNERIARLEAAHGNGKQSER